ncbi:MAG TPA: ATP-binding protein, partial [Longimicrobiaceae bacterium]|nr:ATP-binding protein [Longimicrobiaceae bacterium]
LGLLASGVAHDLNNPLASISGYAQLLLRGESDAERVDDLQRILREVERCRGIVKSLLGFARRSEPERHAVDLTAALREILELRDRELRASGVRLALRAPRSVPPLLADAGQLQQVFLNIVLNAEHALRQRGGGSLRITVREVANGTAPAMLYVDFFNDAPPIPPEVLPRIFDPFFTTKSKDEGTGLGLAVSRRIVRDHGGDITVRSGSEGTVFCVQLPVGGTGV